MDEGKLRKSAIAGDKAQAMISGGKLDPKTYTEAVELLKDELLNAWKISKSSEERERIHCSVNLLDKLSDTLGTMAANGRIAKGDLDRLIRK